MNIFERIDQELIEAIKTRDELKRDVLRGLKSQFTYWRSSKLHEPNEDEAIAIIKSAIKGRDESIQQFKIAHKPELVKKETAEKEILLTYLPTQLDQNAIESAIDQALQQFGTDRKNMGQIMAKLKSEIGLKADMGLVAKIVADKLNQ